MVTIHLDKLSYTFLNTVYTVLLLESNCISGRGGIAHNRNDSFLIDKKGRKIQHIRELKLVCQNVPEQCIQHLFVFLKWLIPT